MIESLGISSQKPYVGRLICGEMGTVELRKGSNDPTTEDLKRVQSGAGQVKGKESKGIGEIIDESYGITKKPKEDVKVDKKVEGAALSSKLGREPTKQEVNARMGTEHYSKRDRDVQLKERQKRIIDDPDFQRNVLKQPINVRYEEDTTPKQRPSVQDSDAGAPRFLPGKVRTTQDMENRNLEQMDLEHDYIGINNSDMSKLSDVYTSIMGVIKSGDLPNLKSISSEFINSLDYKDPAMVAAKLYNFMYTKEYKRMDSALYRATGKHIFTKKDKDMFFDQREEGRSKTSKEYSDVDINEAKSVANHQWDKFVDKIESGESYESMYDPKKGVTLNDREKANWIRNELFYSIPHEREGKIVALLHIIDKQNFGEINKTFKNIFGIELLDKDSVQNVRDAYDEIADAHGNERKEIREY